MQKKRNKNQSAYVRRREKRGDGEDSYVDHGATI